MVMQPQWVSVSDLQALLDAPEQLLQQSLALQLAVASFPDAPRRLLEILVNSPASQVAEAARLHVNWAGEMRDDWQQAIDAMLRSRQLGQNDRLAVELLRLAPVPPCFLSKWVPAERLIQGLRNPHMPLRYRLQLLERLAQSPTLEPRLQVAESPETPLAVLEHLAGDLELPVRLAVKFNPSCPPPLIELVEGQHAVATDWNTDAEQLAMLGQSRWAWVRLAVAQNPKTPAQTLMQLGGDAVYKIQLAVAKNPGTPAAVLAVLAEHSHTAVQAAVAEHPNATEEILHQLFPTQQHLLKKRENLPTSILERFFNEAAIDKPIWKNDELRYLLLRQPNTPTWILAELANVDLEALRAEKLATHQQSRSPEVFEKWIQDDIRFLADVAKHPQVSVEILELLTQYPNFYVQLAVAQNSKTPAGIRMQLLQELAAGGDKRILEELAADPNTPIAVLEQIAERESHQNKFKLKLRRLLTRKPDEDNRESSADFYMDEVRKILAKYQISVDVEEWMTLLESYQWMTLLENYSYFGNLSGRYHNDESFRALVDEQWSELLSTVAKAELPIIIYNVLRIPDLLVQEVKSDRAVAVALVGNPSTPAPLREELQKQLTQPPEKLRNHGNDCDMRMALAYNPQVPEAQRLEYLQQLLSTNWDDIREGIARNPKTPPEIIFQIMATKGVGRQAVSRNPNAPASALAELAQDSNSATRNWVAENPGTPVDILVQLARQPVEKTINNVSNVRESVLNNPNFPLIERYRLLLGMEEEQETAKAHEIMARRPNSPYALAQVLEKGDRNAKLTAARSNKTPIHVLEQLALDSDETVRLVASQNSNLPLHSLLELAGDKSVNVRSSLAYKPWHQKTPTPVQLLERLAQDESEQVRARVAEHPDTPVELLVRLANDKSREVKAKLTGNPNTPVTILTRLGLEENLVNKRNPNTPGIVLAQAVNHMSSKNLADFIENPVKGSQMPAETLAQLASHSDGSVRYCVASHLNTPTSALEQLARDSYVPTLWALAENSNTPPHVLEQLANTPDLTTRLGVARNPHTPARVLAQIVQSTQTSGNEPWQTEDMLESEFPGDQNYVLQVIARNPRTPLEALEILVRREFIRATPDPQSIIAPRTDDDVLQSLADNPNLTPELLGILAQHPCVDMRVCLVQHPNLTEALWLRLAEDEAVSVREAVAATTDAPANVLELLARDEQSEVQAKVAKNPNTPIAVLELLASDENPAVRTATATNSNLPAATLEQLANDEKVKVRRAVAQNPNTPAPIREALCNLVVQPTTRQPTSPTLRGLSRLYNPSTDDLATILGEYAQSENAFVRLVTLLHPLTPGEVLTQGARSQSWLERYAVAENPATPLEIRQQLAQDSNRIIRAAARAILNDL